VNQYEQRKANLIGDGRKIRKLLLIRITPAGLYTEGFKPQGRIFDFHQNPLFYKFRITKISRIFVPQRRILFV